MDEERLARSRDEHAADREARARAHRPIYRITVSGYIGETKYTVHLNSDPVLPIMPVKRSLCTCRSSRALYSAVRSIRCFWDTRYTDDTKQIAFSY